MMKIVCCAAGLLATIFAASSGAQTLQVNVLSQAGAQKVLQIAEEIERMDGTRAASAELAIAKARTAARLQRPTSETEDNINEGRTAFVTAGIMSLRGGMPISINGEVVGAVGIAGKSKETDTEIAKAAAEALGSAAKIPDHS
jgi:glc operon protein GlcG